MQPCFQETRCIFTTPYIDTCENGISDIYGEGNEIKAYPNPVKSTLTIELEKAVNGSLTLFDVNGKSILTKNIDAKAFEVFTERHLYVASGFARTTNRNEESDKTIKISNSKTVRSNLF